MISFAVAVAKRRRPSGRPKQNHFSGVKKKNSFLCYGRVCSDDWNRSLRYFTETGREERPRREGRLNRQEAMPAAKLKRKTNVFWISVVAAAVMVTTPAVSGDWETTYFASTDKSETGLHVDGSAPSQGSLIFSADRDYGRLVVGGSYRRGKALPFPGIAASASGEQFSLRAGYDFGNSLGYVSLGRQQMPGGNGQAETEVLGVGVRVSLNRAIQLTGEYLHHTHAGSESASSFTVNQLSVGAAFRF
jgi:hypothetical protein